VKTLKLVMILTLALSASAALAFHDGGVAECAGCHTMHNSQDGQYVDPEHPGGNAYLLNNGGPSDTCLGCHAGYGQFYNGEGYGPGGDFYWLTKTYSWEAHGHTSYSYGDSHGHNVIANAYGLAVDGTLTEAPGGDFLSERLSCTSCHDPHGNQNFRLLYGTEMGPVYGGSRYDFDNPAPEAKGNSRRTYVGGGGNETDAQHTVYKDGMGDWCANCHTDFHSENTTNFVHPIREMGTLVSEIYNAYISSDDIAGGSIETAYMGLVPFEAVNVDLETVDPSDYTYGATPADQVMCVSCHRAHASPFADIARWDMGETFIVDSHPQLTDEGATPEDVANKYYQYTFVENQRSLCNKCHAKDLGDAGY